jgi:hypothetical protein
MVTFSVPISTANSFKGACNKGSDPDSIVLGFAQFAALRAYGGILGGTVAFGVDARIGQGFAFVARQLRISTDSKRPNTGIRLEMCSIGIETPLTLEYRNEILRQTVSVSMEEALGNAKDSTVNRKKSVTHK